MALYRMINRHGEPLNPNRHRAVRAATGRQPGRSVEDFRTDPAAECRWWNSLPYDERLAFVDGVKGPRDCAQTDWLDIGETNRHRILDAAQIVERWLARRED